MSALADSVAKLQKSLSAFFRERSTQAIIADRCVLKRATEVAGEFITSCCGPPHDYSIARQQLGNFVFSSPKSFATDIGALAVQSAFVADRTPWNFALAKLTASWIRFRCAHTSGRRSTEATSAGLGIAKIALAEVYRASSYVR